MRIVPIVLASGAVAVKQRDAATETIEPGAEVIHGMSQPGPPAVLRGDEYIQPWDTWIGDTVVRQFRETPHDDPVPTQEAIDLMASCPDMSALPDQFRVTMASCLGYLPTTPLRTGLWVEPIQDDSQAPLDRVAVSWTETEFELVRGPELSFHVGGTYSTAAAEELENGGPSISILIVNSFCLLRSSFFEFCLSFHNLIIFFFSNQQVHYRTVISPYLKMLSPASRPPWTRLTSHVPFI